MNTEDINDEISGLYKAIDRVNKKLAMIRQNQPNPTGHSIYYWMGSATSTINTIHSLVSGLQLAISNCDRDTYAFLLQQRADMPRAVRGPMPPNGVTFDRSAGSLDFDAPAAVPPPAIPQKQQKQ